ncbi:MAG: GTPase ObgE [Firmicutes bacterium]|nr:GTPase ObgE [Bacillota bacterium]
MFYDYAKIFVKGGDGGNGVVAFRREKYVPYGGPAGGDGGRGGSVIAVGDGSLKTLVDFRYRQHYKAPRGAHGMGKNMFGAAGEDMYIKVPVGTVLKKAETGELIADITEDGQEVVIAKGGRGGRGNSRFASAKNKAPEVAEKGEPGEEFWLTMELKLLADVGLVGLPNAGKSTLISRISAARPKIADYPFTTLSPNLGVVDMGDHRNFVVADLPGLIEGAHEGAGLGFRFLRHVERNKVILHVIDMSEYEERTPFGDFELIFNELKQYKEALTKRPQLIAANKMELPGAEERLAELREQIGGKYEIYPISAVTGEGIDKLLWRIWEELEKAPAIVQTEEISFKHTVAEVEEKWNISRDEYGSWIVKSPELEKLIKMTDLDNDEAVARLQRKMDKMGFEEALREAGVQVGDTVFVGDEEFEYSE